MAKKTQSTTSVANDDKELVEEKDIAGEDEESLEKDKPIDIEEPDDVLPAEGEEPELEDSLGHLSRGDGDEDYYDKDYDEADGGD